jgi:hypothetical protein
MSNVLGDTTRHQILALGRLGWTLSRIQQAKDFLSEFQFGEVRPVQSHDDRRRFGEPPASGRARDTEIRGDGHIPRPPNHISQSVVIASLRADPDRHTDDHQPVALAIQLRK